MYVKKQRCFLLKYLWSMDLMPGSVGNFYIYEVVPQKNTADWSGPAPPQFSIPHTKPHSSSPTSVCLQHLIHSHCPCCSMRNVSEL